MHSRPIPVPRIHTSLDLDPQTYELMRRLCQDRHQTTAALVADAIRCLNTFKDQEIPR